MRVKITIQIDNETLSLEKTINTDCREFPESGMFFIEDACQAIDNFIIAQGMKEQAKS